MRKEEIGPADIGQYIPDLQDALEAICKSSHFSASPKSCEFLRHIVFHTLRGDADELKERLIGIALLGRQVDYDTGSDAGVRVRANDVRKRLNAYHALSESNSCFTLDLPAGSYIPRFFRPLNRPAESPGGTRTGTQLNYPIVPLPLQVLAIPTLAALFLCIVCIRWQLSQEHPFTAFWQSALQDHHALLYVPASNSASGQELISRDSLEASAPLISLAGQFHTQFTLTRTAALPVSSDDILVTLGPAKLFDNPAQQTFATNTISPVSDRLIVEDTSQGRQIVDTDIAGPRLHVSGSAALLTITNGDHRSIQIDGTDVAAIGSLVRQICERDTFPQDLTDTFQDGTVTQAVFPMSPDAPVTILHELLPKPTIAAARTQ